MGSLSSVKQLKAIFFLFFYFYSLPLGHLRAKSVLPGLPRPRALRQNRYDVSRGDDTRPNTSRHFGIKKRNAGLGQAGFPALLWQKVPNAELQRNNS